MVQPNTATSSGNSKSLEVRLGLVMYGGVSLAIYINGVANEFFNAVRGRGVYKFVKALTDSDVVVDIISGTSAGGINGIMLAHALCDKREFSDAASLWRNDGDIRRLLRSPQARPEAAWSLLDSEGFYQPQLESAFREMRKIQKNRDDPEYVSEFRELDLFVTGTDVDGNRFTQFDDAGHPIDVKDHRSVFHLKHREGRKEPFNPDFPPAEPHREVTFRALAKLSRITSCFPAAFSPVTVAKDEPCDKTADGRLQLWGSLGKESCFLDGGLLDNKPFTHTLREIFFRAAVGKVDRKLFYVEPDPENWEKLESASQPNFFQAVVASLVGIPGYESISDDLKMLGGHNSRLQRYRRAISFLDMQKDTEPPTAQVQELYRRSRLIALSEWIARGVLKIQGRDELLDRESKQQAARLIKKFDGAILQAGEDEGAGDDEGDDSAATGDGQGARQPETPADFLNANHQDYWSRLMAAAGKSAPPDDLRSITADFFRACEKAKYASRSADRAEALLADFDIDFRLRRNFRTIYLLGQRLGTMETAVLVDTDDDEQKIGEKLAKLGERYEKLWAHPGKQKVFIRALRYKKLWRAINRQIELLDIIRAAMEKVIDEAAFDWRDKDEGHIGKIWNDARQALMRLLDHRSEAAVALLGTARAAADQQSRHEWLVKDFDSAADGEAGRGPGQDALTSFNLKMKELASQIAKDTTKGAGAEPEGFVSLLRKIDEYELEIVRELLPDDRGGSARPDRVRRAYEQFESIDAKLFPVELIAELREKDIIKTYRISPQDAKKGFSNKGLSDKVSGDSLYHFGGFFKRSWRSNDILWGRLDSMCQLVETLLDPERLREVLIHPHLRLKVRERFYEPVEGGAMKLRDGLSPARLFPNAGRKTHEALEDWLGELLLKDYDSRQQAEDDLKKPLGECTRMGEFLIEAAQLETLVQDLPSVIQDSLDEQVAWNQFRIRKGEAEALGQEQSWKAPEDDPFNFQPLSGDVDPFFGVVAAAGQTINWIEGMKKNVEQPAPAAGGSGGGPPAARPPQESHDPSTPTETRLGKFFRDKYRVGTEAVLRDMPLLVLLEIVSVSLLVLRNCVLDIFDKGKADSIRSHPLYVVLIAAPLRAFNVIVSFLRRAPRWEKQILMGAMVVSLIVIFFSLWGRDVILQPEEKFSLVRFGFLIFLPALVIYGGYLYLSYESGKKKGKIGSVVRWAAVGSHALLALLPLAAFGLLYAMASSAEMPSVINIPLDFFGWEGIVRIKKGSLGIVIAVACALAFFGPYLLYFVVSGLLKNLKVRAHAKELQTVLENYFSVREMRTVARRLVSTLPFEWEKVHDTLRKLKLELLDERFEGEKSVTWGALRADLEVLEMDEESRLLAEALAIPPAEDGRQLAWKDARQKLVEIGEQGDWKKRLRGLESRFGSYKYVKWNVLKSGLEEVGLGEMVWLLAARLGVPVEADAARVLQALRQTQGGDPGPEPQLFEKTFGAGGQLGWERLHSFLRARPRGEYLRTLRLYLKAAAGGDGANWPFVPEQIPDSWTDRQLEKFVTAVDARMPAGWENWKLRKAQRGKLLADERLRKEWQRRETAWKIVRWARQTGNLPLLTKHMRFVNPEAMYGE